MTKKDDAFLEQVTKLLPADNSLPSDADLGKLIKLVDSFVTKARHDIAKAKYCGWRAHMSKKQNAATKHGAACYLILRSSHVPTYTIHHFYSLSTDARFGRSDLF